MFIYVFVFLLDCVFVLFFFAFCAFCVFLCVRNLFVKKNNKKFKTALITSFIVLLVYMRWNTSPRWDVSPEWGTFHLAFTWEKYPTLVRYFSSQLAYMPIFKQQCYFHCLLVFRFYFKFELLISIHTAKFFKMSCTFSRNNYKNTPSLN